MQDPNDCFQKAMFIASESYSGSTYEADLFRAMDNNCDDAVPVAHLDDVKNAPLAAL